MSAAILNTTRDELRTERGSIFARWIPEIPAGLEPGEFSARNPMRPASSEPDNLLSSPSNSEGSGTPRFEGSIPLSGGALTEGSSARFEVGLSHK